MRSNTTFWHDELGYGMRRRLSGDVFLMVNVSEQRSRNGERDYEVWLGKGEDGTLAEELHVLARGDTALPVKGWKDKLVELMFDALSDMATAIHEEALEELHGTEEENG